MPITLTITKASVGPGYFLSYTLNGQHLTEMATNEDDLINKLNTLYYPDKEPKK